MLTIILSSVSLFVFHGTCAPCSKQLEHQLLASMWDGSALYPASTLNSSTNFSNSYQEFLLIVCLHSLYDLKWRIFNSGVQTPEIYRTNVKKKDGKGNTKETDVLIPWPLALEKELSPWRPFISSVSWAILLTSL